MEQPQPTNEAAGGASDVERVVRQDVTPAEAVAVLSAAMREDYGYAWAWHCNVAMAAVDAGAPHKEANERAAGFMRCAFGVDTSMPPNNQGKGRGPGKEL